MKIINLKKNQIVRVEKKLYMVTFKDWNNGIKKGNSAILKKLENVNYEEVIF